MYYQNMVHKLKCLRIQEFPITLSIGIYTILTKSTWKYYFRKVAMNKHLHDVYFTPKYNLWKNNINNTKSSDIITDQYVHIPNKQTILPILIYVTIYISCFFQKHDARHKGITLFLGSQGKWLKWGPDNS